MFKKNIINVKQKFIAKFFVYSTVSRCYANLYKISATKHNVEILIIITNSIVIVIILMVIVVIATSNSFSMFLCRFYKLELKYLDMGQKEHQESPQ